jgi:hypothetical protein
MRYALGKTLGSLLTAVLLTSSCLSNNIVASDVSGAVVTVDGSAGLHNARTFAVPDTIVELPTGSIGIAKASADEIVTRVRANLVRLGWTDVGANPSNPPDVVVLIAAAERVQTGVAYSDWFGTWGYLPYWGPSVSSASVWTLPDGAIGVSYEVGTVFIAMLDLRDQRGTKDDIPLLWAAALDGIVTSPGNTLARANLGVDQAFAQSPYLRIQ